MLAKAKKYDAIRRGDLSGLTQKEIDEGVIDVSHLPARSVRAQGADARQFERKVDEDEWSDHSSDEDESAMLARVPGFVDDVRRAYMRKRWTYS